jgi:hypothetical protein
MTYKPPIDSMWLQQPSAATANTPPQYPYNNVTQTESGHLYEMDDTPGQERIRLQHGKSGTFFEMAPNGDQTVTIKGDGYEIIAGNKNVTISGVCNITINGDCNMEVFGDKNELIHGDYNLDVKGAVVMRGRQDIDFMADGDMTIAANENFGGTMYLEASETVYIASELQVGGSIACDMINAESRINAGTGLYAGPDGLFSVGPITSLVSVISPLALLGISNSVLAFDIINDSIYDAHFHIDSKGGLTTPSLLPMV